MPFIPRHVMCDNNNSKNNKLPRAYRASEKCLHLPYPVLQLHQVELSRMCVASPGDMLYVISELVVHRDQGPDLLTRINLNPIMDK